MSIDQIDRYTNKTHLPNIICPQIKSKAAKQKYISFMIQTITRMLVKTLPYRPVQFSSLTKPCYSTELGEHLNSSSALQLFIFLCTCPTLCAGSVSTLMGWPDILRTVPDLLQDNFTYLINLVQCDVSHTYNKVNRNET